MQIPRRREPNPTTGLLLSPRLVVATPIVEVSSSLANNDWRDGDETMPVVEGTKAVALLWGHLVEGWSFFILLPKFHR